MFVSVPTDEYDEVMTDENETPLETPKKKMKSDVVTHIKEKKKKDGFNTLFKDMRNHAEQIELNREERHKEMMQIKSRAIEVFGEKMDALLNRMCPTPKDDNLKSNPKNEGMKNDPNDTKQ